MIVIDPYSPRHTIHMEAKILHLLARRSCGALQYLVEGERIVSISTLRAIAGNLYNLLPLCIILDVFRDTILLLDGGVYGARYYD